jgi:hypothetical protein
MANLPNIRAGTCHSLFVYDVAFSIDLNEAERRITSFKQRETIKHKRRAPKYFDYRPAPLRVTQEPGVELVLYDFGAVSVIYRRPLAGEFSQLLKLSEELYENQSLLDESRRRVDDLVKLIRPAVSKLNISSFVEDYVIFQIEAFDGEVPISDLAYKHAAEVAQVLRAESRQLSADEIRDAMCHHISYGNNDIVIVDWNAALVVDSEAEDVLAVLEFANVELLEMRFLDQRLDEALGLAYERLNKRSRRWFPFFRSNPSDLRDVSQWQVDAAILFEGVNNVLKLLGDQYLARLYRLVAERFHLTEWDAGILRKLKTLESIYEKLSDQVVTRRMEVLEWIIIVLFVISIVLPFLTATQH